MYTFYIVHSKNIILNYVNYVDTPLSIYSGEREREGG